MIAVTNDTIANVLNIAIIPSFSTNIWIYPFNLAAANEANSHTPNNSDRYFFGACLLMNEFPSGEKQISDIVSNVPNRNNHSTEALTVSRSEEHTSELQSRQYLVCRLLLEKKIIIFAS